MSDRRACTERRTATRRAHRDQNPPVQAKDGWCLCPGGPTLIGTYRDGDLVALQRRHVCGHPTEHLDPTSLHADQR